MSGQPPAYGDYGGDPYGQGGSPPAPGVAETRPGLTPLGRIGMLLIAVAGVLFLLAGLQDIVATPDGLFRVEGSGTTIVMGVIVAVVALAAAFLPHLALHLVAIGVGSGLALFAGAAVLVAKTNDIFDNTAVEPEFRTGAYFAILTFGLGIVGTYLAIAGLVRKTPMQPATQAPGSAGKSGRAVASLPLSIIGAVFPLLSALGLAFGVLGLEDHRRSGGALGGKGLATAGIIIGLIVLVGYTLGIAIGIPTVEFN